MTIVFFSRYFYPHIGGVEKHVLNISKELIKKKHKVIVITEKSNFKDKEIEQYKDITIYRIPITTSEKRKKFLIWKWLLLHRSIISDSDIVHAHDVFYWYLPFKMIYPSKKVYMTIHGYEGNKMPTRKSKISHKINAILSSGNISIGSFLEKWYGIKATYISYGAVAVQDKKPIISYPKKGVIKALFIGRLEPETGIMEYLKFIDLMRKDNISITIIIAGDGSLRNEAIEYVKVKKIKATFLGFVNDPQKYFSKVDIVFTSRYLGILESLLGKKRVYAFYNNAIKKDYLQMSSFSQFINIAKSIKQMRLLLLNDKANENLYKASINQGYAFALEQSWQKLTLLYIKLWGKK